MTIYIYIQIVCNFLNELLDFIGLHTVKWFQVLLFNTNNSIYQVFLLAHI